MIKLKFFRVAVIAFLVLTGFVISITAQAPPRLHVNGKLLKDPNNNTVILRGIALGDLSSQNYYKNGGKDALQMLDVITDKSKGWYINMVRIPIHPAETWLASNPLSWQNKSHDDFNNNQLKPFIDKATQLGLYVIIDLHYVHDSYGNDDLGHSVDATVRDFWNYIGPKYKDYSNVMYELFNEPIDQSSSDWNSFKNRAQTWVDIIRGNTTQTIVWVGGPIWSQTIGGAASNPILGGNIGYISHIYPNSGVDYAKSQAITASSNAPVMLGEWGWRTGTASDMSNRPGYDQEMKNMVTDNMMSFCAWSATDDWEPGVFTSDWQTIDSESHGQFFLNWITDIKDQYQPWSGQVQQYSLTTSATNGTIALNPSGGTYDSGTVVTATANASSGYHFVNWSGDASGTSTTVSVTMSSNKSITANFAQDVASESTITINARGNCGSETMVLEVGGSNVKTWTNVAASAGNYTYDGYISGVIKVKFTNDANAGCDRNLFVDYIKVGSATFQTEATATRTGCGNSEWLWCNGDFNFGDLGTSPVQQYTLSISATNGTVTLNPAGGIYDEGSIVTATANASSGYHFVNWSGDASGTSTSVSVTMSNNKSITANFAQDVTASSTITINARGTCGTETMVLEVGGINVKTWTNVATSAGNYTYDSYTSGVIKVKFTNDANVGCDRNLIVDYIKVGTTIYQTENTATRTGCGSSEWLWCNGDFNFGDLSLQKSAFLNSNMENISSNMLAIYPNPVKEGVVNIIPGSKHTNLEIYNLQGQVVLKQFVNEEEKIEIFTENLRSGIYIVKVDHFARKLVIE